MCQQREEGVFASIIYIIAHFFGLTIREAKKGYHKGRG